MPKVQTRVGFVIAVTELMVVSVMCVFAQTPDNSVCGACHADQSSARPATELAPPLRTWSSIEIV